MKRVFGMVEVVFDILYMLIAFVLGMILLMTGVESPERTLAGIMALVLVGGDAFHLVPRIIVIVKGEEEKYRRALGKGKQITSITMTIFYVILWMIGLEIFSPSNVELWTYTVYLLALVRIILCLLPKNRWEDRYPPVEWGIYRNIPFFIQGMIVAGLYFVHRNSVQGIGLMWLAIILSFAFYLPVVLWSNKNPKVGMLMLPKTCTYLWILFMLLVL